MYRLFALIFLSGLLLLVRLSSPVDLFYGDQPKQVGYMMDILHGGDLSIQYEVNGNVSTKPPFYNWCAAAFSLAFRSTAPWIVKLPSLLAGLGLLRTIYLIALRLFDKSTAFWSTAACVSAHHFAKLVWFARTDMLMTFGLYLAIYLSYRMRSSWYKPVIIGLLLGANFLTKGPVGPSLFTLWFLLWCWKDGLFRRYDAYPKGILSGMIAGLILVTWLALVWDKPQFQDTVIASELGERISGQHHPQPLYYHLPNVFSRIAPWTFVAVAALFLSRRRPEWTTVRFVALWALLYFAFFSLIPAKRADHLLPVYPPIFILAGVGMQYLLEPKYLKGFKWPANFLACAFTLSPILVLIMTRGQPLNIFVWSLVVCVAFSGMLALRSGFRGSASTMAIWIVVGLITANGLYHHGVGNSDPDNYGDLLEFSDPIKESIPRNEILVWKAHPLVSYELGLHQRNIDLDSIEETPFAWLLTTQEGAEEVTEHTRWSLEETSKLAPLAGWKETLLFRIRR